MDLIRRDTARQYRRVRKLLRGNTPELTLGTKPLSVAWVYVAIGLVVLAITLVFSGCARAYTLDQWADSIRITEGIHSKYPYGIKSVHVNNEQEARAVCKRTVLHAWKSYKGNTSDLKAFINVLANKYCPPSCDYMGNINWKHNMYLLMKGYYVV